MIKYFLLIVLFVFKSFSFDAQDLDALKAKLKTKIHDTTRLNILAQLVELEEDGVWQTYNQERKKLAQKNRFKFKSNSVLYKKYSFELAEALFNEGINFSDKFKDDSAIISYRQSLKVFVEIKSAQNYGSPLYEIATIYSNRGNYERAILIFYRAIKYFELIKDYNKIAESYLRLADASSLIYDEKLTLLYNKKALNYYKKSKLKSGIYVANCNIADFYILKKNYTKANSYLRQARKFSNHAIGIEKSLIFMHQGTIDQKTKKLNEAILNFQKSLEIGENEKDVYLVCISKWLLGSAYENKKEYALAEKYTLDAYVIAKENNFAAELLKTTQSLMFIFKEQKKWEQSVTYAVQYSVSLHSNSVKEAKSTQLQEQYKHHFEKKELLAKAKAEKASFQRNVWIISISALILIIGIFGFFSFKNTKQKKTIAEQKSNILKQKLLVSQMNPHFIFNSLNAIQNCIFKEDGLTAGTYLAQFADLMRMILDFSRKDTISLESEIKLLENYLQLQQFRFNNKFEYEVKIDSDLIASQVEIPPMLAQPFIENAIEHGIFHLKEKGLIQVKIFKRETNLRFEIEDNGIGLKKSDELKPKIKSHESLATIITQERINALFLNTNSSFDIEIHDLCLENENQTGVRVIFEIPFKQFKR
ncbi:MAG: histidine kinase [Bacteroidota bacterium]